MTNTQEPVAMPPQLTVRETTPDQVPPLPDAEKARRYIDTEGRYAEGALHAGAGAYQKLVLDVRRGELYFYCNDWRVPRDPNNDVSFPPNEGIWSPFHWLKVPDIIWWTIDAHFHVTERPFLTLDQGNAFARTVAPLAEALLLNLLPVPGTDTYDWSAEAASAGLDIMAACTRHQPPPKGRRPELVNMAEAVSVHPALVQDRWATLDDTQLDEAAEHLNRCGLSHNPAIAEGLGIDANARDASLVGTRAWLYEYRRKAAAGRPMQSLAVWLAANPLVVTADTTNAELETVPEQAAAAAAAEGIVLLGATTQAARTRREQLRQEVLDELATYGKARADAEAAVKSNRAAVYARLYRTFAWEERYDGRPAVSDTDLGKLARVSRQAVGKLREQLDETALEEETTNV
ncbi:hypothetical protein KN815_16270 [Streptomyces sp. 4503]|uniref:Uncharacterized protein n=1 Tax=Streptomyces niphimycinicus TaxID=2842201 RepID=A0ABS6CF72_9ACTN|nr:hypothetical protein [Streptomyces niphimycinicus]MBU3865578.1 hypothetical protein [Streptomyces niphimycinicus]